MNAKFALGIAQALLIAGIAWLVSTVTQIKTDVAVLKVRMDTTEQAASVASRKSL
jgi:hypothetical protein